MKKPVEFDVLELIPQRPPFVMVDKLLEYEPTYGRTNFFVKEDNIFTKDGEFSHNGVLENMAQTCAAHIGYKNTLLAQSIKIGVIGAIKNFKLLQPVHAGQMLDTKLTVRNEVFSMTLVDVTVEVNKEVIATCEMKIALSEKEI